MKNFSWVLFARWNIKGIKKQLEIDCRIAVILILILSKWPPFARLGGRVWLRFGVALRFVMFFLIPLRERCQQKNTHGGTFLK